MVNALVATITSPDGSNRVVEFTADQLASAAGPLLPVQPTEIVEVKINSKKVELTDLLRCIELLPGEVDLDADINAEKRSEIEARWEFAYSDMWDLYEFDALTYQRRFVLIEGLKEPLWMWLLETTEGFAPIFISVEGPVVESLLADHSWFSDGGGAPVSWDGGAKLYKLIGGVYANITYGDVQEDPIVVKTDNSEAALVDQLLDFCLVEGRLIDSAFALESTQDDRVAEMVGGLEEYSGFDFNLDEATTNRLREELYKAAGAYRFVKEFLENPREKKFEKLFVALAEVPDVGVTGEVNGSYPEWYDDLKLQEEIAKKAKK